MVQVDIYHAQSQFLKIIEQVLLGVDVIIERDQQPVVKMTSVKKSRKPRKFGSAKGLIKMADDFDEPLEEFREYM